MRTTAATTDAEAVLSELDELTAKLNQLRELLTDTRVWALVKHIFPSQTAPAMRRRRAEGQQYGGIVQKAYECVLSMDGQSFTKRELAEKVRATGHEIRKHRHAMYYAIQRFITDGVIELVERGGGKRPNKYQRIEPTRDEPCTDAAQVKDSTLLQTPTALPKGNPFRARMMKTAFECIQQFSEPFAPWQLVRAMERAGYEFILSPESSIQPVIRKLVNEGFLVGVREQNGEEPARYERGCADSPVPSR